MILLFDFDHTLFDTEAFNKGLAGLLGLDYTTFKRYEEEFIKAKALPFNPYYFSNELVKNNLVSKAKLRVFRSRLLNHLRQVDSFVFPDALPLLASAVKKKHNSILLTFGDPIWQRQKVTRTTIKQFFQKIIYTDKPKETVLDFLSSSKEEIVIINDRPDETEKIRSIVGGRAFLVLSEHSKETDSVPTMNLRQIQKALGL